MPQSSVWHQDGRQRMDGSILGRHPPLPNKIQRSISKQRRPSPLGWIPWFRLSTCEIQPDQTEIIYCISSISTPTYTQSIPTIAAELKYSPSIVRRGIRDLKKAGLLETEQRYKKGGKSSLLSGRYSARQIWPKPTALFLSAVVKAWKTTKNKFIAL